ncbi:flavodoxin domain-containing protein [Methanobacterium aggregans]|uniref:flavodoxin domain-containing protein n=1 Tax=Methanobacterium aggregans TaxID=1615586 RepID=UPI001AE26150|nr:flavodoxin domain-containing protein [Methanobacterium aggregans]MBP2046774.1 menaquinone-dependent protoporphyrinogen IX oxidase/uncharacterized protein YhbP (UPF0306 family) [Methanobacterium aggregans]
MQRTLVVYESRYGSTRVVAKTIALILGPAVHCVVDEFKTEYQDFDFVVLGSPIYRGDVDPKIRGFINENRDWLSEKPVALFCTCIDRKGGIENLKTLEKLFGNNIVSKDTIGGRLKLNNLDLEDYKTLESFLKQADLPFEDMDFFSMEEVIEYSLELKNLKEDLVKRLDPSKLRVYVEDFLLSHNTCTLATSFKNRVRATPLEYFYSDGFIYILTEGGEKFANLIMNQNVSLAIHDPYNGMASLAGMQITGKCDIIQKSSSEYWDIIDLKGINRTVIESLPVDMNIIKIGLKRVEFLYHKFRKGGWDTKQILTF